MDTLLLLKAALMGIVEGLTEFLPVSSTGHLILAGKLLDFAGRDNVFEIVIQTGAILAVILLYFGKLWRTLIGLGNSATARRFALAVTIAFLPAAVLGVLVSDYIKLYLFNPLTVGISLIVGGIIMLLVDRSHPPEKMLDVDDISLPTALKIGLFQCIAMIPGVSRSGATIIGAQLLGVGRKAAAEFSFFLAIPTLIGAGVYDLLKTEQVLTVLDYQLMAVGFAFAFLSAIVVIKGFITWLTRHGFGLFAVYRIAAGLAVFLIWRV